MPKNSYRGRNNNRKTNRFVEESTSEDDRNFYGHDNRDRRGIIKSGRIDRRLGNRNFEPHRLRTVLEQDVEMGAGSSSHNEGSHRHQPYISGRGNGRRNPRERNSRQGNSGGIGTWGKIIIPQGKSYDKTYILKTLLQACQYPFIPIQFYYEGNSAVFYVESREASDSLARLNKTITLQNCSKLIIVVKYGPSPNISMNDELKDKIKNVMSRRYDQMSRMLNLSQFHNDEELCLDYYTPLSRGSILLTVVQIICDNIPDVQVIDLSCNNLYTLEHLKLLASNTSSLRSLNLSQNNLKQVSDLNHISDLPLEALILDRNPMCDRFTDRSAYISAVRKRFPKLINLDEVELPPVISFDISADDVKVPPSKGSFFVSDESRQVALIFLEQYLSLYDSDDRQPLLHAYHDHAVMSLTSGHPTGQAATSSSRLDNYVKDSRNLKRIEDSQRRFRLLHQGKVDVVSFISKLPKTQHDPASLVVDVPVSSDHLIVASVTGLFRERGERQSQIRWFQRVFVIIPHNGGYCICNEQMHVSSATPEQTKSAFKVVAAAPAPIQDVVPSQSMPVAASDPLIQQQMLIVSFAEQSKMNLEWSKRCLEQNDWDFNKAATAFTQYMSTNSIPPEAFIK